MGWINVVLDKCGLDKCGLDKCGTGYNGMEDFCEHCNEHSC